MTTEKIILANSNLANCRPQNAWKCSSRANKERNFAEMFKVIYGTEQFFAQKLEVNFCSKQIAV